MLFEQRKNEFEKDLQDLFEKYKLSLYPANALMQNGEVVPVIKTLDLENKEVKNEDKSKK